MSKAMSPIRRAELEIEEMEKQSAPNQDAKPNGDQNQPPLNVDPPANPEPPRQEEPPKDEYYQRWKSLEGIVRSKDSQIQQMMAQNQTLLQRMDELMARSTAPAAAPEVDDQPVDLKAHLAGLYDKFGDDMIDAMSRVSQATQGSTSKDIAAMKTYIERLEAKLTELSTKTQYVEEKQNHSDNAKFKSDLLKAVPDYERILDDPRFAQWADQTDVPYSDMTFRQLFDKSNEDWSLKGMAGVFTAFKEQHKPQEQKADPRLSQLTPGSRGSNSENAPDPQTKVWSESAIDQFYRDATRGKYSDAEYARIEREIDEANARGLVTPG